MHLDYQPSAINYGWTKRTQENLSKVLVNCKDIELYIRTGGKNARPFNGYNLVNVNTNDSISNWSAGIIDVGLIKSTIVSDQNMERVIDKKNLRYDTIDQVKDPGTAVVKHDSHISANTNHDSNLPPSLPPSFIWPLRADNCECWLKQLLSIDPELTHHCTKNVPISIFSPHHSSYFHGDVHSSSYMTEKHESCF